MQISLLRILSQRIPSGEVFFLLTYPLMGDPSVSLFYFQSKSYEGKISEEEAAR